MPRLKLHRPEEDRIEDDPMRFPTEWFDEANSDTSELMQQIVELAEDERDLVATIRRLQSETRAIEDSLTHVLKLVDSDSDDPPTAA
ncbi:MAG: hypothetical protein ACYTF7_02655 [Planctomycetota bacterium]|jgi:hypothetical protein